MEYTLDNLTSLEAKTDDAAIALLEEKAQKLLSAVTDEPGYLIGPDEMRDGFNEVLSELYLEIDERVISKFDADTLRRELNKGIAASFDQAVQQVVFTGGVTNEFLDVIREAPVGLASLSRHMDKWHNRAVKAQMEVKTKPKNEQLILQQQANLIALVAAEYGAAIPETREDTRVVQSGSQYKLDWLRNERKDSRGKDPASKAKFEAVNQVCVAAYGVELKDPNALIEKVSTIMRRAVASVAVAGVLSALPNISAHADTGAKTTEVLPNTPSSDKQVAINKKISIVLPTAPKEAMVATVEIPADKVLSDKKNDEPALQKVETTLDEKSVTTSTEPNATNSSNAQKTIIPPLPEKEPTSAKDRSDDESTLPVVVATDKNKETDAIIAPVTERAPIVVDMPAIKADTDDQAAPTHAPLFEGPIAIDFSKIKTLPTEEAPATDMPSIVGGPIRVSLENLKKVDPEIQTIIIPPTAEVPPAPVVVAPPKQETPAPPLEKAPIAALPEVVVDPALAGETLWTAGQLEKVRDNLGVYLEVQQETTVPWEVMAAVHVREHSLLVDNPANGQGIFQLFSSRERFTPGPVSREEFKRQTVLAANFLLEKKKTGAVYGELLLSDPDKVKDVLFSYNGRAPAYAQQASTLGYKRPAEGSPYVMNLADDKRNNLKNPQWGQILTDGGPLGKANQAPGAWPLIEGLVKINKISHDRATEVQLAADAKKAAEAQAAAAAVAAEKKAKEFTGWKAPVPEGSKISSPFGPRGGGKHDGEDYSVPTGTPFFAAVGGKVKVLSYDVSDAQFCKSALANIGVPMSVIKDPIQKEVQITSIINGEEYVSIYAHMSEISVAPDQIVSAGEQIGKTGGSGCSTGDHAHFEVRKNGKAIDPAILLRQG